jgi:hypothetical protein
MEKKDNQNEVVQSLGPVMRLVGHSAGAVFGFAAIAILALIPIAIVKFVVYLGATQLIKPLHYLETMMLFADVVLFTLVFLNGLLIFLVESLVYTKRELSRIWKEK